MRKRSVHDNDVISLDYDVIVLLSVATHQLVVSIHYIASVSTRDKLRIEPMLQKSYVELGRTQVQKCRVPWQSPCGPIIPAKKCC